LSGFRRSGRGARFGCEQVFHCDTGEQEASRATGNPDVMGRNRQEWEVHNFVFKCDGNLLAITFQGDIT
jgi:hypothetical protein